jgi:hypothetical protein
MCLKLACRCDDMLRYINQNENQQTFEVVYAHHLSHMKIPKCFYTLINKTHGQPENLIRGNGYRASVVVPHMVSTVYMQAFASVLPQGL